MRKLTTLLLVLVTGLSCSKDATAPLPTVTVIPDSATVNLFDHLQLRAVVVNSRGDTLSDPLQWYSASPDVVFTTPAGLVQALNRGTVTVTAYDGNAAGTARIKVKITVTGIILAAHPSTLQVGDTTRLQILQMVTGDGLPPDDSVVTWRSSDTSKATVSQTGFVTARAPGAATITAQVDSAIASAPITVPVPPEPVTAIILSAHLDTLRQDSVVHITATPIGTHSDTLFGSPVSWTSSDTSIAKLTDFSFDTYIGAYKPGRAVIRAQIASVFDSMVVIVVRPSVASIVVSPDTGRRILPGGFALHATIKDSTGVLLGRRLISWTVSDTSIADVTPDTGTDVGLTGKNPGTVRVRATSEGKTDSATLQFVHPSVTSVRVSPDTGTMIIPGNPPFDLHAEVQDSVGDVLTDRVISWTVTDTSIAQLNTATGTDDALFPKKSGLAIVVASADGVADTARIRIIRPSVAKIAIVPDTASIVVPGSVTLQATIEDSLSQPLCCRAFSWSTPDTALVAISDTTNPGTIISGKASGTARIVASSEGVHDTAIVHVILPSVAQVVFVAPVDTSPMLVHSARFLTAEPLDSNGTPLSRLVTITSSDSSVVKFKLYAQSGPYTSGEIDGLGVGAAVITASSGGKSVTWHASVYSVSYDTVAAGSNESCMPASDGRIYCWGKNGNLPFPTPVVTPAGMHGFTAKLSLACGLDPSGSAYCWGTSGGPDGTSGLQSYDSVRSVAGGTLFSQIDVGWDHLCGVTSAGDLSCWGNNDRAQLGLGDSIVRTQPTALTVGTTFASVSAGRFHTCAVATGGQAYCWGANGSGESGQPGGGNISPMPVSGAVTFSVVSAGYDHSCGLSTTGAAYCWGANSQGQLGTGDTVSRATPTLVSGGLTFKAIAAGLLSTCAVTTGGAAYCWGYDGNGTLGTPTLANSKVPVAVSGGLTFTSIGAGLGGNGNVCGMTTSGAYCWGVGAAGGVTLVPVKIPGQP